MLSSVFGRRQSATAMHQSADKPRARDPSLPFPMKLSFYQRPERASFVRQRIKRFIRRNVLILRIRGRIKPPKRDKINASIRLNLTAASSTSPNSLFSLCPRYSALPIRFSRRRVVQKSILSFLPLDDTLCSLAIHSVFSHVILFVRPPDIHVGGLMFYHGLFFFFLLFSPSNLRAR